MNVSTQDLMRLKERIDRAKTERSRLEGELRSLESRMKEEFGTADPDKIQVKVAALRKEAEKLRKQVEDGVKEIEEGLK